MKGGVEGGVGSESHASKSYATPGLSVFVSAPVFLFLSFHILYTLECDKKDVKPQSHNTIPYNNIDQCVSF